MRRATVVLTAHYDDEKLSKRRAIVIRGTWSWRRRWGWMAAARIFLRMMTSSAATNNDVQRCITIYLIQRAGPGGRSGREEAFRMANDLALRKNGVFASGNSTLASRRRRYICSERRKMSVDGTNGGFYKTGIRNVRAWMDLLLPNGLLWSIRTSYLLPSTILLQKLVADGLGNRRAAYTSGSNVQRYSTTKNECGGEVRLLTTIHVKGRSLGGYNDIGRRQGAIKVTALL
ncbi:hypothetical protein EV421DRAFT_1743263 [Armillaria borealis]|uniref:Uncharacterized protein n=1 Tax=Armillaria borealis TaxID=47425 RepID=A0AA39IX06_9AGAR|nr:hypothetical protein EV421DRAFT_1743263 [Armillaria borealis]